MTEIEITQLLKSNKLKITPARLLILSHLSKGQGALSYGYFTQQAPDIDRVTIYRTLDTLKQKGIIHQAYQENKDTYYALCAQQCKTKEKHLHDHLHFKCIECTQIYCLPLIKDILPPSYEVQKIHLQAEGICEECQLQNQ